MEPVVKLAGYLGMRRSKICGLKWKHMDLTDKVIYIYETYAAANGIAIDKSPKSPSLVRRLSFAGNEGLCNMRQQMYQQFMWEKANMETCLTPATM